MTRKQWTQAEHDTLTEIMKSKPGATAGLLAQAFRAVHPEPRRTTRAIYQRGWVIRSGRPYKVASESPAKRPNGVNGHNNGHAAVQLPPAAMGLDSLVMLVGCLAELWQAGHVSGDTAMVLIDHFVKARVSR